jgi:predicted CXXCH cytochrome family protein
MSDSSPIPPACPRRKSGRVLAWSLAFVVWLAIGCSHQNRYKVLSFFFDGVPDPNKPAVVSATNENGAPIKVGIVSIHKPYAAGKCDACHQSTGGEEVGSAQTVIDSSVCMKCHQDEMHKHAITHAPVAAGACLFCHNPHNSALPHLLATPAPALCTQCHDRSLLGSNPPEHLSETSNCLDCHVGHGEEKRGFLLRAARPKSSAPPPGGAAPWTPIDMPPEAKPATRPAAIGPSPIGDPTTALDTSSFLDSTPPAPTHSFFFDEAPSQEGPVVIGELHRPPPIGVGAIDAALEFRYRYQHDTIVPRTGPHSSFTENRLEEDVTLATTAYVIHPNFLDIKLSGTFGARQTWDSNNGETQYNNEVIYNYDVEGTFLRKENVPITVYSRRSEDVINQQFGPSFDSTIQTTGAFLDVRSIKWPTHVEAYHSDQEQTSFGGQESYKLSQNVFTATSSYEFTPTSHVAGSYTYNNNFEQSHVQGFPDTSNAFDTHDASLSHTYAFGPGKASDLNSSVTYFKQTGDFSLDRLTATESLHLTHSDTFQTRYVYNLNYQDSNTPSTGGLTQTENNFYTGFTHHLFESLVTNGDAGVKYLDRSDNSGSFGYWGTLFLDYHKKVPLGLLTIDGGYTFDQQDNRAQTSVVHIFNEPHTFSIVQPIILAAAGIIPQSIVVKNSTGVITFILGSDYTMQVSSNRVELSLVLGGRITDGTAVLIDYDLSAQPANLVTNQIFTGFIRYDIQQGPFQNLGFYGRYIKVDQNISSNGTFPFVPNDLTGYAVGLDYRIWEARAGAEYEWHASSIAPYNAARAFARLQHRAGLKSTYGLDVTYTDYDYYEEPNRIKTLQASGNFGYAITPALSLQLTASYLNENDRLAGTTNGYQGSAEIQWTHRQTHMYIQFRESILDSPPQRTQFQSIWFGLRRTF